MKKLNILLCLATLSVFCLKAKKIQVQTNKCYCSDLCGPRDIKPDDAPFVDEETCILFCQQRDLDNYEPHQCALKPCKKNSRPTKKAPARRDAQKKK